jgi:ABC-type branched-subunit amino acid transport system substrate-binding protein
MAQFFSLALRGAIAIALGAFALAATAAEAGVSPREIVIGQSITLQGGKNAYGSAVLEGVKLQIDAVNAAGGVNGRRIVLKVLDDDNKNATAEANARKLVQDGAFILFGSVEGGPSTAVMKVAGETKVPFFGPMAGPPILRRPHQPMVFPVRAEHRDEFRALMNYGKTLGMNSVGFFHVDSDVGRQHLANVSLIAKELGMTVAVANAFKSDATDADLDRIVAEVAKARPDLYINHGSAGLYQKLITKARNAGLKTMFMGVNSGSSQIAKGLGELAFGMVFAQVVPSPWERKREITREYQAAALKANPNAEFSYGGLEGFLTAKALVRALQLAGNEPTRASFIKGLEGARIDLGGVSVRYAPDNHEGSRYVDLALVRTDGRFTH